jgi:hypothetical protein
MCQESKVSYLDRRILKEYNQSMADRDTIRARGNDGKENPERYSPRR